MSRLTDLIAQTKAKDPQLCADLDTESKVFSSRVPFALNLDRSEESATDHTHNAL